MMPLPVELIAKEHARFKDAPYDLNRTPLQLGTPGPWRVTITSILSQRYVERSRAYITTFFDIFKGPFDVANTNWTEVHTIIEPLFSRSSRKARQLVQLCDQWWRGSWTDLRDLPGVNLYVADCVGLFCFGDTSIESGSRDLLDYIQSQKEPAAESPAGRRKRRIKS
jgi:endonuclease III